MGIQGLDKALGNPFKLFTGPIITILIEQSWSIQNILYLSLSSGRTLSLKVRILDEKPSWLTLVKNKSLSNWRDRCVIWSLSKIPFAQLCWLLPLTGQEKQGAKQINNLIKWQDQLLYHQHSSSFFQGIWHSYTVFHICRSYLVPLKWTCKKVCCLHFCQRRQA